MGFYSTHQWRNGAITTVERIGDNDISIRVQGPNEQMLMDIVLGEYESLCLAQSILSVLTKGMEDNSHGETKESAGNRAG